MVYILKIHKKTTDVFYTEPTKLVGSLKTTDVSTSKTKFIVSVNYGKVPVVHF